ncbi:MAG: hypothetical protein ACYDAG_07735 [Chloroflexota bacterium]
MRQLPQFETASAELRAEDVAEMLDWPGINCLGKVMDYRAVVRGDPRMIEIIDVARSKLSRIDGHCPELHGG